MSIKSILDPSVCGFGKVAAFKLYTRKIKPTTDAKGHRNYTAPVLDVFKNIFNDNDNFIVNEATFKSFRIIVSTMHKFGKSYDNIKKDLLDHFSTANWQKLSKEEQETHSLFNCRGCLHSKNHKEKLKHFAFNSQGKYKKKASDHRLTNLENMYKDAKDTIEELDLTFQTKYGKNFQMCRKILY